MTLTQRQTNPVPYVAQYFEEKLHIDQNEKLIAFGITHVCAVDGFSGKIIALCSMPIKNNRVIYEHIFLLVKCSYLYYSPPLSDILLPFCRRTAKDYGLFAGSSASFRSYRHEVP